MKSIVSKLTVSVLALGIVAACSTSPTGRSQLNLLSSSQLNQMGADSWNEIRQQEALLQDAEADRYIQCITDALVEVLPEEYQIDSWEVEIFDSEMVNAFALPGGYIGMYVGMMRLADNQHQLAAVMGHEIGHVMAEHSNERVSQNLLVTAGLLGADFAFADRSPQQRSLIMAGLGIGAQVGYMLPYSRRHESEADEIGMELMADAGFDPKEAPKLWQNMQALGSGGTPEMLSTHPSPGSRIDALNEQLPSVMPAYEARLAERAAPTCKAPEWAHKEKPEA
ncbi:peptidase [Aliidiomarina sedimenti]|uniref:Peptidase n=2 Tax=Aliidiomarina TaxID=1249554 RepID=A0A432WLD4_9GAMM|nr:MULTISPECIES: M48 family metallopeptidase [Aliidiomarina]RUO32184.1 peptidase [Aliidiomarina sedimenti]RUO34517.1 peptidase [Aliidiomarina soli]